MTIREQFIEWLADAHAMEVGIISTLEKHEADAKDLPKVKAAIAKHLRETKRHATDIEKALNSLGSGPSVLKEGVSKVGNLIAGVATSLVNDTPVKNAIADITTEHFEIACYLSLIFTATALGEDKIAATCKRILKDELAMADKLIELFPTINAAYLAELDVDPKDESATEPKKPARKKGAAK